MRKKYTFKVYNKAGTTFKGTYGQLSNYSFSSTANGGLGELKVELPKTLETYWVDDYVEVLDHVEIWLQDKETTGRQIYSGYVSRIDVQIGGGKESVVVICYGYASRLGMTLDRDSASITVARNSMKAGEIIQDIIDKYQANAVNPFIADGTVDTTTGDDISYTSNNKLCVESIERVRQMADGVFIWRVNADNTFDFQPLTSQVTHSLSIGKEISQLNMTKTYDDVVNNIIFWNGLQADDTNFICKRYQSSVSEGAYWDRWDRITDSRITDSTSADQLGLGSLTSNSFPRVEMSIVVADSNYSTKGYDIESIKAGEMIRILNTNNPDINAWLSTSYITKLDYTPEAVTLHLLGTRAFTGKSLTDIRRQLDSTVYGDSVSAYTTLVDLDA